MRELMLKCLDLRQSFANFRICMEGYGLEVENYPELLEMQRADRKLFAQFQATEQAYAIEDGNA